MNQTQMMGRWLEFKGSILETVGKWFENTKLRTDGQAQRVRGRIQAAASNTDLTNSAKKETKPKATLN